MEGVIARGRAASACACDGLAMGGSSADEDEDELLAELYGGPTRADAWHSALGRGALRWSVVGLLLIAGVLTVAPWRGGGSLGVGMLGLREVYGRRSCAAGHPCVANAPFDIAAEGAAETERALLLSMETNGVAILRNAVPTSTIDSTRADLAEKLATFVAGGDRKTHLGLAWAPGIKEPELRDHVQLDPDLAAPLLRSALKHGRALSKALANALGEDAMMVELAVIRSHAGAGAQQLHTDTTPRFDQRDGKLWTVFIPLQLTNASMGPLQVCAGSQTCLPVFGELESDTSRWCDQYCQTITTSPGDVVVMDSRIYHRGNRHDSSATISRSTLAMSEDLWGAFTLRSLSDTSDEQKTLKRAVPEDAAQAALSAARNRMHGKAQDPADTEARRRLFWDAAVVHSAAAQQLPHADLACWELQLSVPCIIASFECTMKRSFVDVPERGLGLVVGGFVVVSEATSSLLSRSVVTVAILVPVTGWHLLADRDPIPVLEQLSFGLQLAAFEFGCALVFIAVWFAGPRDSDHVHKTQ